MYRGETEYDESEYNERDYYKYYNNDGEFVMRRKQSSFYNPHKAESYIEERLYEAFINRYPSYLSRFNITLQAKIYKYRVDFLIVSKKTNTIKLVVECDGHDFHEKTKEQVAKDKKRIRDIQRQGYRVISFSGSEINKDIDSVVCEIKDHLESLCEYNMNAYNYLRQHRRNEVNIIHNTWNKFLLKVKTENILIFEILINSKIDKLDEIFGSIYGYIITLSFKEALYKDRFEDYKNKLENMLGEFYKLDFIVEAKLEDNLYIENTIEHPFQGDFIV